MRLTLAARLAASRFASFRRGHGRSSRGVWIPLALRWRRRRDRAANDRLTRPAAPLMTTASVAWLAQFHLHFSALANDRSRRQEPRPLPAAAVTRELQRLVMHRHSAVFRTATPAAQPRAASRPAAMRTAAVRAAVPKTHAVVAAAGHPRALPLLRSDRRRAANRHVHPLFAPSARVMRTAAASHEPARSAARPAAIVARELHVVHLRSPRLDAPSTPRARRESSVPPMRLRRPHALVWRREPQAQAEAAAPATLRRPRMQARGREESAAAPVRLRRSPELVWRTAPGAQTEPAGQAVFPMQRMAAPRPPAGSAAAQETAPEAARRAARAPLRAADFDPGLLDRLTDDVIRRVERRARIERERRGL